MSSNPFPCIQINKYMASLFIYHEFHIDGYNGYAQFFIVRLKLVRDLDIITKWYLGVLFINQAKIHALLHVEYNTVRLVHLQVTSSYVWLQ